MYTFAQIMKSFGNKILYVSMHFDIMLNCFEAKDSFSFHFGNSQTTKNPGSYCQPRREKLIFVYLFMLSCTKAAYIGFSSIWSKRKEKLWSFKFCLHQKTINTSITPPSLAEYWMWMCIRSTCLAENMMRNWVLKPFWLYFVIFIAIIPFT